MSIHPIKTIVAVMLLCVSMMPLCHADPGNSSDDVKQSRRFPADQVVSVTPEKRSFTIKIDTLVDSIRDSISRCNVEVIDPNQERHQLAIDENGIATVRDAEKGLYVVVAANDVAYGTIVIACRETTQTVDTDVADDLFQLDFEDSSPNSTTVLMMIPVIEQEIRPVVKNNFPEFPFIVPNLVDRKMVIEQLTTPGAENIVQLGKGGALRGKLTSVIKAISRYSGVEGTLIVVYKDGKPVGKTTANGLGQFQINGLKSGAHGLVVAGRGGFAAFGIKAVEESGLIDRPLHGRKFSFAHLMNDGEILPVILSPPTVFPLIKESIASLYENVRLQAKETDTMLAQTSPLDAEDQQTLDTIRTDFANQQAAKAAPKSPSPPPKRRSRSRIIPESNIKAPEPKVARKKIAPPQVAPPQVAPPQVAASQIAAPQIASRKQPVNPLRRSANGGSTAPFNPLRAN